MNELYIIIYLIIYLGYFLVYVEWCRNFKGIEIKVGKEFRNWDRKFKRGKN